MRILGKKTAVEKTVRPPRNGIPPTLGVTSTNDCRRISTDISVTRTTKSFERNGRRKRGLRHPNAWFANSGNNSLERLAVRKRRNSLMPWARDRQLSADVNRAVKSEYIPGDTRENSRGRPLR